MAALVVVTAVVFAAYTICLQCPPCLHFPAGLGGCLRNVVRVAGRRAYWSSGYARSWNNTVAARCRATALGRRPLRQSRSRRQTRLLLCDCGSQRRRRRAVTDRRLSVVCLRVLPTVGGSIGL